MPLYVFHLRTQSLYVVSKTLAEIRRIQPKLFAASTCSRIIYIYESLTAEQISSIQEALQKNIDGNLIPAENWQIFQAREAYQFLLQWAVGLESSKYNQNDPYVLGALRKSWTNFSQSTKSDMPIVVKLMDHLFEQASHVRSQIQVTWKEDTPENIVGKAVALCDTLSQSFDPSSTEPNKNRLFKKPPDKNYDTVKQLQRLDRKIQVLELQLTRSTQENSRTRISSELERAIKLKEKLLMDTEAGTKIPPDCPANEPVIPQT